MIKLKPLMRLDVTLAPFLDIGKVPAGHRRIIPITGGRFEGERLRGDILPGGADWNLVRPDGTVFLWARYTLRTDDGVLIMITNEGFQTGPRDTMHRILTGQPIDTSEWYSRTRPVFEVADGRYAWLNSSVFVGDLLPPTSAEYVSIEVSEVL
jgi:hypothetical protein